MTSVSFDLHIRTTGHWLHRSIPIRIIDSPATCLQSGLAKNQFLSLVQVRSVPVV